MSNPWQKYPETDGEWEAYLRNQKLRVQRFADDPVDFILDRIFGADT